MRKKLGPRSGKTISPRRMRKDEVRALKEFDYSDLEGVKRPRTRGECREMVRPCPFVACKYHLYLDINQTGSYTVRFADKEPWEVYPCCALDVAEEGEHTLEEVGKILGVTRERVRQLEAQGCNKLYGNDDAEELWQEVA